VRSATRKNALAFNTSVLNGYKQSELSGNLYIGEKAYCVIDVSGGTSAASYPVTYLDSCPIAGWGDEYKTTKILLRRIESGTVKLGDIKPVTLTKPFYMGVFEITQKQYQLVTGSDPSQYKGDMRPVECVSWNDIRGNSDTYNWPTTTNVDTSTFIGKLQAKTGLNFDLPTESQGEYACRAGTTTRYNNGGSSDNDLKQLGRYSDNRSDGRGGYSEHTVVGSYSPNVWGLYDMHGNVWEWCLDWCGSINSDPVTDFTGAASGSSRIIRGSCWDYFSGYVSSSDHGNASSPGKRYNRCGLRLSRTLTNE
jgi:formylglycine-generating enzyme required for sulfatase activity